MPPHSRLSILTLFFLPWFFSACGSMTGIPSHGGGKRFAVEQELVASATRGAIQQVDLSSIQGRRVNLFVNSIGDTGAGNLLGGRLSLVSQLKGEYIQTPATKEYASYPRSVSTSETISTSGDSTATQSTTTDSLLGAASYRKAKQDGAGSTLQLGAEYKGLGSYQSSEEITSDDLQYLSALFQTYLYLRGVQVVMPSEAEVDVYITVDVFGTIYTRIDWFFANNEILRAKTSLEVLAVDHETGELIMEPQAASAESEYNEQYIIWMGPVSVTKSLRESEPLLSDFTKLGALKGEKTSIRAERQERILRPFQERSEPQDEKN